MTLQIANLIMEVANPHGVAVDGSGSPLLGDARREEAQRPDDDLGNAGGLPQELRYAPGVPGQYFPRGNRAAAVS